MSIFLNKKLILCLAFIFVFIIFAGVAVAQTATKQVGDNCISEAECISGICLNNKCASCDQYCKDNDYDGGTCLGTGGPITVEAPKPNYFCDASQFCNHQTLFTAGSQYCKQGPIGNICWCGKYEEKESCSPDCDLRCGSEGCRELKKGFVGCRFGTNFLTDRVCSWNLKAGYNLISFPINVSAENVKKSFSVIAGRYSSIQIYNSANSQWQELNLSSLYNGAVPNSYLIKMNQDSSFSTEGNIITVSENAYDWLKNTVNSLQTGWNLVAFPYFDKSVSLSGFFGAGDLGIAKVYSLAWGSADVGEASWVYFLPASQNGSLLQVEPGMAYWIFKKSSSNLACDSTKCGKGLFNICDEKECLGLGACYFQSGIIGGKCIAKCNHDSECTNSCPAGKFSACDLATNKCGCENTCTDSDNGTDVSNFGVAGGKEDNCKDTNNIEEFYCVNNRVQSKIEKCPYGCSNGFCKQACYDSDGGQNYNVMGTASNGEQAIKDQCSADGNTLTETYCNNSVSNQVLTEEYRCPYGCKDGVCFKTADKRIDVLFRLTRINSDNTEKLTEGVKILIYKKGSTSLLSSCFTNVSGECSATLSAGEYTAKINDAMFSCNGSNLTSKEGCSVNTPLTDSPTETTNPVCGSSDCPRDFTVEGTNNITVNLYAKFMPPKTAVCKDTDGGENFDEKGAVKVWYKPGFSFSLYTFSDSCIGNQVREYSCGDEDAKGVIHETLSKYTCPYGCFNAVCVKSCSEEFGSGYVCSNTKSETPTCLSGTVKTIKTLGSEGYCNLAGENRCVLCEKSCDTVADCGNYISNCPSYHAVKCGEDKKCFCERQLRCQGPGDCEDLECPAGETASCSVSKTCFCLKGTVSKTIKVKTTNAVTGLRIPGVLVKIIDEKQEENKEVGSCVTALNGSCQLESPIIFSAEHEYWAIAENVNGYEDAKLEMLSENNSASFYAYLDLEPSGEGSNENGSGGENGSGECEQNSDCKHECPSGKVYMCKQSQCECLGCTVDAHCYNISCQQGFTYFCNTSVNQCGCKPQDEGQQGNPPGGGSSNEGNTSTFEIKINKGLNLISSPFVEPLTTKEIKEAGCEFRDDIIDGDKFLTFLNGAKGWFVPQIGEFQAGFIHISNDGCTVKKTGKISTEGTIELRPGTNLISVNKEVSLKDIENTCKDKIINSITIDNSQMVGNDPWNKKTVVVDMSDKMYPGKGYYVSVSSFCELKIGASNSSISGNNNSVIEGDFGKNCGVLYKNTDNYAKAINFILVPADSLYGNLLSDSNAQYANNLDIFLVDAKKNIDDFLAIEPINNYKNLFNFFYSEDTIRCVEADSRVKCDSWQKSADSCNIPYDEVVIMQRKEGGGSFGGTWIQSSSLTTLTFIHEIGHYFGLRDYDNLSIPGGPNHCNDLDCCGGSVCKFKSREDQKPIESGGSNCCLYVGNTQGKSFYIPNEKSVMSSDIDYKGYKFNHLEESYLNSLFATISSKGKESVKCYSMLKTKEYCF